jgi:hypothetical protein
MSKAFNYGVHGGHGGKPNLEVSLTSPWYGIIIVIVAMYILPLSVPEKGGVILYGLVTGVCALVATMAASVILGCLVSVFLLYTHLAGNDGGGGWLVIGPAFYGFYGGIVVAAITCWRVCRSRLRKIPTE